MGILRRLLKLNLFVDRRTLDSADNEAIHDQILSTRLYIVLLTATILITTLFTVLRPITVTETVSKPSLDTYLQLETAHFDSLSCLCHQSVTRYDVFLSLEATFHEVRPFLL